MEIKLSPLINNLQKLTIYETYHSLYIIGSNLAETYFKVLKLDRTCDLDKIEFSEDIHEYDKEEVTELLSMINNASTVKTSTSVNPNGILKRYKGFAIVGFIRFLEGYYLILVTKQIPIAILGYHTIYTIEDAVLIYIPYEDKSLKQEPNLDEQRYLKLFQTVDLRQNFYYSFTYDLTHSLQYNLSEIRVDQVLESGGESIGYQNKPEFKYVWNEYLLKPLRNRVSHHWIVNLVHGYLAQSSLNIYGCSIFITLISRRSQKYAGTRFLKRGGTREGYVANEVETEQIVHNAALSSFQHGEFTSFVHMRGSIPLLWSQDPNKVPKPPINIDIYDPFSTVAAAHFQRLLHRYGAPIIILNLVKMREKKAQESTLAHEYKYCLEYLQQFLPNNDYFQYIYFDMAKLNKTDKGNVMNRLYDIAENCVQQTGIFQNFKSLYCNSVDYNGAASRGKLSKQRGIVRVNCVDCLDRTNTAMYVIGKCALAYQLYALGVITQPFIEADSICEKMLIDLYEKSGDSIAQQYAGSQLVHRVDTYGSKNTLASQSRDFVHTISRYYSNAFSDADKQSAINLFLGVYKPFMHTVPIWELPTDIYLHDPYLHEPWKQPIKYNDWIDEATFYSLPQASDEATKTLSGSMLAIEMVDSSNEYKIDMFNNYYKPFKLTIFHETYYFNILPINRLNETTQNSLTSGLKAIILDPFSRNKKQQRISDALPAAAQTQAVSAHDQVNSSDSEIDDAYMMVQQEHMSPVAKQQEAKIKEEREEKAANHFSDINVTISESSLNRYKKYVDELNMTENRFTNLFCLNDRTKLIEICEPRVTQESESIYRASVAVAQYGATEPDAETRSIYEEYIKNLCK